MKMDKYLAKKNRLYLKIMFIGMALFLFSIVISIIFDSNFIYHVPIGLLFIGFGVIAITTPKQYHKARLEYNRKISKENKLLYVLYKYGSYGFSVKYSIAVAWFVGIFSILMGLFLIFLWVK